MKKGGIMPIVQKRSIEALNTQHSAIGNQPKAF
jgi:hypothetical protein